MVSPVVMPGIQRAAVGVSTAIPIDRGHATMPVLDGLASDESRVWMNAAGDRRS